MPCILPLMSAGPTQHMLTLMLMLPREDLRYWFMKAKTRLYRVHFKTDDHGERDVLVRALTLGWQPVRVVCVSCGGRLTARRFLRRRRCGCAQRCSPHCHCPQSSLRRRHSTRSVGWVALACVAPRPPAMPTFLPSPTASPAAPPPPLASLGLGPGPTAVVIPPPPYVVFSHH